MLQKNEIKHNCLEGDINTLDIYIIYYFYLVVLGDNLKLKLLSLHLITVNYFINNSPIS